MQAPASPGARTPCTATWEVPPRLPGTLLPPWCAPQDPELPRCPGVDTPVLHPQIHVRPEAQNMTTLEVVSAGGSGH